MLIEVKRHWYTVLASVGAISVKDGTYQAFSVEDVARAPGVKIPKETAIPAGTYAVQWTWSERHKEFQPQIMKVPMFSGVRFDIANTAKDVEGCIGVGHGRGESAVWDSRSAWRELVALIKAALDRGELVWVTITNEPS